MATPPSEEVEREQEAREALAPLRMLAWVMILVGVVSAGVIVAVVLL